MGLWKVVSATTGWQTIDINFTATGNPEFDQDNVMFTIQAGFFLNILICKTKTAMI